MSEELQKVRFEALRKRLCELCVEFNPREAAPEEPEAQLEIIAAKARSFVRDALAFSEEIAHLRNSLDESTRLLDKEIGRSVRRMALEAIGEAKTLSAAIKAGEVPEIPIGSGTDENRRENTRKRALSSLANALQPKRSAYARLDSAFTAIEDERLYLSRLADERGARIRSDSELRQHFLELARFFVKMSGGK